MKLDVLHVLRSPGTQYPFSVEQTMAPLDISGQEVSFDPVKLEGTMMAGSDGSVTVDGSLSTVAHTSCANCLAPASGTIAGEFRETFLFEGDPEDDEIFAYTGSALDLEKLTLTYVLLNMPSRFLCREDCVFAYEDEDEDVMMLCQDDLNVQRPFAALQQLLAEKSDNAEN
ncbi:MAG: DUF177 domain-containing protein [Clostridia bacterium]|nr:DUF177 domain-containing protein [Clostridia bacterium]